MYTKRVMFVAIFAFLLFMQMSCNTDTQPIVLGKDYCSFCKMGISDQHFGAEIISKKGKVFKFDDVHCVLGFMKANMINRNDVKEIFLVNFAEPHNFIEANKAFLLKSNELHSPMGGNIASFNNHQKMDETMKEFKGEEVSWSALAGKK